MEKKYHSHVNLLLCMLLSVAFTEGAPKESLVTSLPGFTGTFPSRHYSGYVSIDDNPAGRNLFYYLVVSERNSTKDPVVLWLNGGPGCSSFDGFVYEHGPFNFEAGKTRSALPTLHLNPYSWSKVSNIVYLDSPCGVGLSYSTNSNNYDTGDLQTAAATHAFLLKWFELFPEFINNPFYIAGESYAGVYVPTLAAEVVKGMNEGAKPVINFKGYMVGNGVTDAKFDGNALVPFVYGMGLISNGIFHEVNANCGEVYYNNNSEGCLASLLKVEKAISGLNIYDVLEPCYHDPANKQDTNWSMMLPLSFQKLGVTERPLAVRKRMFGRAWPLWLPVRDGTVPLWPQLAKKFNIACVNDEVATSWLNDDQVREAIHAASVNVSGSWELCTERIKYRGNSGSMIPYHKNLTTQNYRALIFSGDHDMCVPFTGSQAWTQSLGYRILDEWRHWMSADQVAGYLQEYDHNLTFLTIKGAGHTVPEYKPREALDFYTRWLDGNPI
ncbi:hypothetical protein BT93_H1013 [Corymbia citriodora subsp. variegata]|nr:hypothetical protein BT93_H1013 [Corymbia citriodora subsp. variegata]